MGQEEEEEEGGRLRLAGQSCQLPNLVLYRLEAGKDGALALAFSHSGRLLACPSTPALLVYKVRSGRIFLQLAHHKEIIYDVKWSPNDNFLASVSGDSTACIWDVKHKISTPLQVLCHPSYVYCCVWLSPERLATGGFDSNIRVWRVGLREPCQWLAPRHSRKARVQALAGLPEEGLTSGDNEGLVVLWARDPGSGLLQASREVRLRELRECPILQLHLHGAGKRLLIHSQDSTLRMIDLQTGAPIQWYQGGVCRRVRQGSTLCGCSAKVLACSEDGVVAVWDTDSGRQVALYGKLLGSGTPPIPATLAWHPHENVMASVTYSPNSYPLLNISTHSRTKSGAEVGLVKFESSETTEDTKQSSEVMKGRGVRTTFPDPTVSGYRPPPWPRFFNKEMGGKWNPGFEPDDEGGVGNPSGARSSPENSLWRDSRLMSIINQMDRIILSSSTSRVH